MNSSNWYQILDDSQVSFGFPNPPIDALGYRTLAVIQLAEIHYGDDGIFDRLIYSNFSPRFVSTKIGSNYTVTVPEVQTPINEKVVLRASSIQLIPLLETGRMDYCFLYRSNAEQYGFDYVELPDEIDLGSPQYQEMYERVLVKFEAQRFATISLDREGRTIGYGATIPVNALHPEPAVEFLSFILDGEGKDIFNSCRQSIFEPSYVDRPENLPEDLRQIVVKEPDS